MLCFIKNSSAGFRPGLRVYPPPPKLPAPTGDPVIIYKIIYIGHIGY